MEKLLMCRICLCNDIPLRSLVDTHLQKIYEALTMTPLVAGDSRPSLACDLCCSRLETCYELRRQSLCSEELFRQLLRCKVQVNLLQVMFNIHPSMEDVMQTTSDVLDNGVVKQEDAEDIARDDSVACSDSEDDTAMWDVLETALEVDDVAPSFEENSFRVEDRLQSSDSEDDISPAVVKEDQSDVTANAARDDSGASSGSEDDTAMWDVLQTALELDDVAPSFEENSFREEDYLQSSDSEDVISLAVVKKEESDVTASAPRLSAQKYCNDTLLNSLNKSDQTMDKVEERERETRRDIEDTLVEKSKMVKTSDNIDIKLHHDKQNNSTSDHNYARKEMCENKISAYQSVNSNSSDKLTLWSCDTCQKCFASEGDLITHSSTHSRKDITLLLCFECNLCKKWFSKMSSLVEHIRTHTKKKPFECNVCKKCFSYKSSFQIHIRTHTGEKPYECNICKKCFVIKGHLASHMRIHTGEKPYECNVCKKRFIERSKLTYHTRTHTGEKPYKCNVCKKCFAFKQSLDRHRRSHTGEKPFQCNICKKRFSVRNSLVKHIRNHPDEETCELLK